MTTDSLHPFGTHTPHTQCLSVDRRILGKMEAGTTDGVFAQQFRHDVEKAVCGEINEERWCATERVIQPIATPAALSSKSRSKSLSKARHWCWFILFTHPKTFGVNLCELGRAYQRDHTTIWYGLLRISHELAGRWPSKESRALRKAICRVRSKYSRASVGYKPKQSAEKLTQNWKTEKKRSYYHESPKKQQRTAKRRLRRAQLRERNFDVCASYRSGNSLVEVGTLFHLSSTRVRQILIRNKTKIRSKSEALKLKRGWGDGKAQKRNEESAKREEAVLRLKKSGLSYSEIGKKLGVTRSAVGAVVYRHRQRMENEGQAHAA